MNSPASSSPGLLSQGRILAFWSPLAATWLMMSVEGPLVAAVIARLPEPKFNLAAYGVALALAMLCESPIIMLLSAATALVRDRQSFRALARFSAAFNIGVTLAMLGLLLPPVFHWVAGAVIGLPPEVETLAHGAAALMLPWPAAIGYRRFYQGVMIRHHLTRRVAYGTVVRVGTMAAVVFLLYVVAPLPGVYIGALAHATGVVAEAIASRLMAAGVVRKLQSEPDGPAAGAALSWSAIGAFYFPLALTSILLLGVHPTITFFLGRSRQALESLATAPVIGSFLFLFRSAGIAFQEVGIALLGDHWQGYRPLRRFALVLGGVLTAAMGVMAFTPLAGIWFQTVAGLTPELAGFTALPVQILALIPALEVWVSLQRSMLVHGRRTRWVTAGTLVEVGGIVSVLFLGVCVWGWIGVYASSTGILVGRIATVLFLARPASALPRQAAPGSGSLSG